MNEFKHDNERERKRERNREIDRQRERQRQRQINCHKTEQYSATSGLIFYCTVQIQPSKNLNLGAKTRTFYP